VTCKCSVHHAALLAVIVAYVAQMFGQVTFPNPSIESLDPVQIAAGAGGFPLTVKGSNFVAGSTVQWNGSARPTTVRSSTQLIAQIPASDIAVPGTANITILNPGAGGSSKPIRLQDLCCLRAAAFSCSDI
jgi:hypothetical protein